MYIVAGIVTLAMLIAVTSNGSSKTVEKGNEGEYLIQKELKRLPKEYSVINNILLEVEGKTSQIDHIVISPYGMHIIETKNYNGWIFGDEESLYWTQILFNKKSKFYNPIKQNEGHINILKNILKNYNGKIQYRSIVAFSDNCTFKEMKNTSTVVHFREVLGSILKNRYSKTLTNKEIDEIKTNIKIYQKSGKKYMKKHIKSVKNKIKAS